MALPDLNNLRELLGSYRFVLELQHISRTAGQGDAEAQQLLERMLEVCADWNKSSRWCSAALSALAQSGTDRALELLSQHAIGLKSDAPYGAIELIASLFVLFARDKKEQALKALGELAARPVGSAARAVGLQGYCNFFLEGYLDNGSRRELALLIQNFKGDRFFTQHVVDLVAHRLNPEEREVEHELQLYSDFLVEYNS